MGLKFQDYTQHRSTPCNNMCVDHTRALILAIHGFSKSPIHHAGKLTSGDKIEYQSVGFKALKYTTMSISSSITMPAISSNLPLKHTCTSYRICCRDHHFGFHCVIQYKMYMADGTSGSTTHHFSNMLLCQGSVPVNFCFKI